MKLIKKQQDHEFSINSQIKTQNLTNAALETKQKHKIKPVQSHDQYKSQNDPKSTKANISSTNAKKQRLHITKTAVSKTNQTAAKNLT